MAVILNTYRPWWLLVHREFAVENPELLAISRPLDVLRGHTNYTDIIAEFLLVPAQALNPDQHFYASSYQHADASVQKCDNGVSYYLSRNYVWFLKKLKKGLFAWIDVLCIAPAGQTLSDAFLYMGTLYSQAQVLADYLKAPRQWFAAEKRGWIYQESAFTTLSVAALDKSEWNSLLGLISLCKLCKRRGLWTDAKQIGQLVADQLTYETVYISGRVSLREQQGDTSCKIDVVLRHVLKAAEYQSMNPNSYARVWNELCEIDEAMLKDYEDNFADEYNELHASVSENGKWGEMAQAVVHHNMQTSSISPTQAASLLIAYNSCDLYDENNRDVAILGLASICLNETKVLEWCWRNVEINTDIFVPIKSSSSSLLGLGKLFLKKEDAGFYTGTGLVLRGQAGNSVDQGTYVSVTINGSLNAPTHLQIIVNKKNYDYKGVGVDAQWLDECVDVEERSHCFYELATSVLPSAKN
jgi:hypothetical protein